MPATGAGQVWAYDFVFDACANGQHLKCLTVVDEFTRECLAIDVAGSVRSGRVVEVLGRLVSVHGAPKYLRSDNVLRTEASSFSGNCVPGLFGEICQPLSRYLLVPKVSSITRRWVPIDFCDPAVIASGSVLVDPNATIYDFGVLQSQMHVSWVRAVCGRMKSDFQYSARIVYNDDQWPDPSDDQRDDIAEAAQGVLDA